MYEFFRHFWDNLNRKRSLLVFIFLAVFLLLYKTSKSFYRQIHWKSDLIAALNKKEENTNTILPIYQIIINADALKELEKVVIPFEDNSRYYYSHPLREVDQDYVKARLIIDDVESRDVKIKYRGDNYFHWGKKKKSWRVKFKGDDLFLGRRKINLNSPKFPSQIDNFLSYTFANQMHVLSPYSYFVHARLNREYLGLMLFVEQIDKFFLINHRLPEGKIYYLEKKEAWKDSSLWEKPSSLFSVQKKNPDFELEQFIHILNLEDHKTFIEQGKKIIHVPSLIKWHAFSNYFGLNHQDINHNIKIVYDPSRGMFLPLVWDPVLGSAAKNPDKITRNDTTLHAPNPIWSKFMSDPSYQLEKNLQLWKFFSKDFTLEDQLKIYKDTYESIRFDVIHDNLKEYTYSGDSGNWRLSNEFWEENIKNVESFLYKRKKVVEQELNSADISGHIFMDSKYNFHIEINHKSISGLKLQEIEINLGAIKNDDFKKIVIYAPGFNSEPIFMCQSERECLSYIHGKSIKLPLNLNSYASLRSLGPGKQNNDRDVEQWEMGESKVFLKIEGLPKNIFTSRHNKIYSENLVTHKSYQTTIFKSESESHTQNINQSLFKNKSSMKEVVWEKDKIIDHIFEVSEHERLIIKPGITLSFKENSGLYIRGEFEAVGTHSNPIVFQAMDPKIAWQGVAILGDDNRNIHIEHSVFKGGSELNRNFVRFSGMLSIYHANANLKDVHFISNHGEDALNIKYSKAMLSELKFNDISGDALDCDFCELTLENSSFVDIKNDALDVSYTRGLVRGLVIDGIGDKGFSIGERSQLILHQNKISNAVLDVIIKDESHAYIDQCDQNMRINMYIKKNEFMHGGCLLSPDLSCINETKNLNEKSKKLPLKIKLKHTDEINFDKLKAYCSRQDDYDSIKKKVSWVDLN